jgi:hypothetical protein
MFPFLGGRGGGESVAVFMWPHYAWYRENVKVSPPFLKAEK